MRVARALQVLGVGLIGEGALNIVDAPPRSQLLLPAAALPADTGGAAAVCGAAGTRGVCSAGVGAGCAACSK